MYIEFLGTDQTTKFIQVPHILTSQLQATIKTLTYFAELPFRLHPLNLRTIRQMVCRCLNKLLQYLFNG